MMMDVSSFFFLNLQITEQYSQEDNFVGVEILSFRYLRWLEAI